EQRRILRLPVQAADLARGAECSAAPGPAPPDRSLRPAGRAPRAQRGSRTPRLEDGHGAQAVDEEVRLTHFAAPNVFNSLILNSAGPRSRQSSCTRGASRRCRLGPLQVSDPLSETVRPKLC